MPTYEDYAPYRPPLSDMEREMLDLAQRDEEELRADPTVQHWERGWIDGDGRQVPYPIQQVQLRIALDRASAQLIPWQQGSIVYPDDPGIVERFPGIDPRGKACEVDMSFTDRYAKLQAALPSRPSEIQRYVGQRLQEVLTTKDKIGEIWGNMRDDCLTIRLNQRAAMLAENEETSRWLTENTAAMVQGKANIQRINGFLNVLEYVSGLTDRVPTDQERQFMENIGIPIPPGIEASRDNPIVVPEKLEVEFANFGHQVQQKFFSDPRNWDKGPGDMPRDAANPEAIAAAIGRYSRATADRVIDPLFSAAEKASNQIVNRGDLITVDGKTIREKMFEEYVAGGGVPDHFGPHYKANFRQKASEYVSAGLMAGKRVEVFVPGKDGRIPDQPIQVTKTGYEPSPLQKVTLNAWQRHFSKYGYFKEKVAKAAEYQRVMDARERVQAANLSAQFNMDSGGTPYAKDQFFSRWVAENGPLPTDVPNNYSVTRSALTTLAVCALAARGHTVEEINDPARLVEEKQAMGREVIERLQAGDQNWAGETLFHGQRRLVEEIDRLTAGMDFTNEQQVLSPANRALFCAANAAFDASQEDSRCHAEALAAAERYAPGHGREVFAQVANAVNSISPYFRSAQDAQKSKVELAGGLSTASFREGAVANLLSFEAMKQAFAEKRAADPQIPMSRCYTIDSIMPAMTYTSQINKNPTYQALLGKLSETPSFQTALGREAITGTLQKRLEVKIASGREAASLGVRPSPKEEIRTQRIQETAQKNAAKAQPKLGGGGRTR